MKKILLLITILISVFGIWALMTVNFFDLAFHYEDALIYCAFAGVDYLVIRWIGSSLGKKFNSIVEAFLKGEELELKIKKRLLRNYGFLLVALLPFLLFLMLLAVFVAISFSYWVFILISNLPRIPVALILALIVIPIGSLLGFALGFWNLFFPANKAEYGINVKLGENKALWKVVDDVAEFLQTKKVDKVLLTPSPGIGVYLQGNNIAAVRGKGDRTLEIGLSSIDGLTVGQFKAILAHEYGHLSNKDTQWSAFTYAMGVGLTKALSSTPGPSQSENEEEHGGIFRGVISLNPAWWILLLYTKLYFKVTGGFSRVREVMADLRAIELSGGQDFAAGLKKVVINDYIFNQFIEKHLLMDLLKKEKVVNNFSKLLKHAEKQLSAEEKKKIEDLALGIGEDTDEFDTHPVTKTRLEYSKRFKTVVKGNSKPVTFLFDDWDDINEKVAELYNKRLFAILRDHAALKARQEAESMDSKAKKDK